MLGRTWPNRGEKSLVHSLRSRRALLLAGGCCSSLLAFALPSQAVAQSTDPAAQTVPPVTTDTAPPPADPNAPPPPAGAGQYECCSAAGEGTIVVTGIRESVQDSISIKRREASMVEAVSAEEIGKLPDVSIAESIARLPGITAQRVRGRAQIVSIRGFSPDFTTVLLNGRQQASSGYNRAVEFDQYPSELLASVVVYKTPDASISGMGLAGTVDLRTIRPLEYGKRAIALNMRGELDEGGGRNAELSKYGWRGSASYIDQNEAGTLGWMVELRPSRCAGPYRPHARLVLRKLRRRLRRRFGKHPGRAGSTCLQLAGHARRRHRAHRNGSRAIPSIPCSISIIRGSSRKARCAEPNGSPTLYDGLTTITVVQTETRNGG